ncbi:hypothetical protein NX059_010600 [Plenodomus lindquistii]|nr:hypothetical protein NX059_010600 [Plenodomus lindquistii]
MPRIEDISYSRENTVAAVRDYYHFLVSMYLDESNVLEPPEGGWPSIPVNGWENFDKTDEVVALLRELPYLRQSSDLYQINGAPYTVFADWQDTEEDIDGQDLKDWSEPDPDEAAIPAHVVGLTVPSETSPAMLLDTELGVIYWYECPGDVKGGEFLEIEGDPYDWGDDDLIPEDQVEWGASSGIWPVDTFFEMLKAHFRKLNFVPIASREVQDVWVSQDGYAKQTLVAVQNIHRKHGWPNMAHFSKQSCSVEIETLLGERDPTLAR